MNGNFISTFFFRLTLKPCSNEDGISFQRRVEILFRNLSIQYGSRVVGCWRIDDWGVTWIEVGLDTVWREISANPSRGN